MAVSGGCDADGDEGWVAARGHSPCESGDVWFTRVSGAGDDDGVHGVKKSVGEFGVNFGFSRHKGSLHVEFGRVRVYFRFYFCSVTFTGNFVVYDKLLKHLAS